jgi:hypothetical protein
MPMPTSKAKKNVFIYKLRVKLVARDQGQWQQTWSKLTDRNHLLAALRT